MAYADATSPAQSLTTTWKSSEYHGVQQMVSKCGNVWSSQLLLTSGRASGDNVGAFTLLMKMRPGSPEIAIIARGLALRLVELSAPPDAVRTPGLAHKVADLLPRVHAPGTIGDLDTVVHPAPAQVVRTEVPVCNKAWYKAYINEPADAWRDWNAAQ